MNYNIKSDLGDGAFGLVKLAQHKVNKSVCALKLMPKNDDNQDQQYMFENEVSVLSELSHPNIVGLIDYDSDDTYYDENGESHKAYSIALELCSEGELFDIIAKTGSFSEELSRHYFHQMVDGLEHIWSKGLRHRDIKLENMLLDDKFVLKYIDFGYSTARRHCDQSIGTTSYLAPEVFTNDKFRTKPLDIFALGIVLFTIYTRCPPFDKATSDDYNYKLFVAKNEKYWNIYGKRLRRKFSSEFKTLINDMLSYDPKKRPSLSQIKKYDWYQGSLPIKEQVVEELSMRSKIARSEMNESD